MYLGLFKRFMNIEDSRLSTNILSSSGWSFWFAEAYKLETKDILSIHLSLSLLFHYGRSQAYQFHVLTENEVRGRSFPFRGSFQPGARRCEKWSIRTSPRCCFPHPPIFVKAPKSCLWRKMEHQKKIIQKIR